MYHAVREDAADGGSYDGFEVRAMRPGIVPGIYWIYAELAAYREDPRPYLMEWEAHFVDSDGCFDPQPMVEASLEAIADRLVKRLFALVEEDPGPRS